MVAVLRCAAAWRLVYSQWISSSGTSVIKVRARPLQLCNRTLHAEQGRRSSAMGQIMHVEKGILSISCTGSSRAKTHSTLLTFLNHWGLWCHCRVGILNVASEVGLPVGQVFVEQATYVAWKEADFGASPERCMLLLIRVSGVKESLAVGVLAKWLRRLRRQRVLAVHPKVVFVYWAVV